MDRYELFWRGKIDAKIEAEKTSEQIIDIPDSQSALIVGDNLPVLRALQNTHKGLVKMIYIDPPYNTGKKFSYNDRFYRRGDSDKHSNWLNMMLPRLYLARNLLRDDGVIFVSIDDNEAANLKLLMDEVFGAENFVDSIIWKKRYGGGAKEKHLVTLHEYVLFYAKNIKQLEPIFIETSKESIDRYYKLKDDNFKIRGGYCTHPLEATKSMGDRPNLIFPIKAPDGTLVFPKRQWLWGKDRVDSALNKGELAFLKDKDGGWSVHTKQYLKDEAGNTRKSKAFSIIDDVFTQHGTNEIIDVFGNAQIFSFPKPTKFIKKLLNVGMAKNNHDVFLDFFAGSGTTAQAVMELNEEDGGNRRYICVQLPERTDENSEAAKAGYATIADITAARIKKVIERIKHKNPAAKNLKFAHIYFSDSLDGDKNG